MLNASLNILSILAKFTKINSQRINKCKARYLMNKRLNSMKAIKGKRESIHI